MFSINGNYKYFFQKVTYIRFFEGWYEFETLKGAKLLIDENHLNLIYEKKFIWTKFPRKIYTSNVSCNRVKSNRSWVWIYNNFMNEGTGGCTRGKVKILDCVDSVLHVIGFKNIKELKDILKRFESEGCYCVIVNFENSNSRK